MQINSVKINHPTLGVIIVNSKIEKSLNESIGNICEDYCNYPFYYHAKITLIDGNIFLKNFGVIKSESIHVGLMDNSKGYKNFITVIVNRKAGDDCIIYPSCILSII